jgi:hypothetical protein
MQGSFTPEVRQKVGEGLQEWHRLIAPQTSANASTSAAVKRNGSSPSIARASQSMAVASAEQPAAGNLRAVAGCVGSLPSTVQRFCGRVHGSFVMLLALVASLLVGCAAAGHRCKSSSKGPSGKVQAANLGKATGRCVFGSRTCSASTCSCTVIILACPKND